MSRSNAVRSHTHRPSASAPAASRARLSACACSSCNAAFSGDCAAWQWDGRQTLVL